jgi:hypothetical protein
MEYNILKTYFINFFIGVMQNNIVLIVLFINKTNHFLESTRKNAIKIKLQKIIRS